MPEKVRVRFAPSPTGPLHIGGVRTALYNYLFAKKYNGDFILRIEDTDRLRLVEGAEQYIIDALTWIGISPDEGAGFGDGPHAPYRQSERKETYRQYAEQLVRSGHAYYAFDTEEELEEIRAINVNAKYDAATRNQYRNSLTLNSDETQKLLDNRAHYVIRIKLPEDEDVKFYDEVRGNVIVNTSQMDDKVLLKSDGMPTYHLANVCDDYVMQISHVIRGEEWLPSAPLHVLLYRYLGWEADMPKFAHLPLLLSPDGNGKLKKRDGDKFGFPIFPLLWTDPKTKSVSIGYREQGYLPGAVLNMLALLGWNPGNNQEIFSREELIEAFSMDHIHKSGAKFDFEKAKWFNSEYIKRLSDIELANLVKDSICSVFGAVDDDYLVKACCLVKERLVFTTDLITSFRYLFEAPTYEEPVLAKVRNIKDSLDIESLAQHIPAFSGDSASDLEHGIKEYASIHELKTGDLLKFIRVSLVGEFSGPAIPDLILLLGKEETVRRIRSCYARL
jgi:glutamyl-tRNA synthetase